MKQYIEVGKKLITEGQWIKNERTGVNCLTLINADFTYDVDEGKFPILTTKKTFYKGAIAELLGYIRGYDSAKQFRDIGTKTWDANANENEVWLKNPNRKGEDDMGRVYGVQGRGWQKPNGEFLDQFKKVYENLKNGIDDRGEIITFWNPGEFELGCLRPCMHTHQFSLVNDTLYLNSFQRSGDYPLGVPYNAIQCYVLLALMAQITGHKCGKTYHKIVNVHIYENQLELFKEQMNREPFEAPKLIINPEIKSLEDLETWVSKEDFKVEGYQSHEAIKFPFSV